MADREGETVKGLAMRSAYEKRMIRVLEYIHENPAADMSLDTLADVAAMSRFHWHRVFFGMTGETCAQAVRRIRMNRAACWLRQSDLPVEEIAAKVGYPSPQSFGRVFRSAYGMAPVQFRKDGAVGAPQLQIRERPHPMHDVTVEAAPARRLAAIAHKGSYLEIGGAFEKLGAIAASRNLWPEVEAMVGVYLDDPDATAPEDLRSYAGLELKAGAGTPEGLEELSIAGGEVARLRFVGPYAGLHAAYGYLFGQWLPDSGREPGDQPCYEIYVNHPGDTAPEDLITDICLALKP